MSIQPADELYIFYRWAADDVREALIHLSLYSEAYPLRVGYAVLRYAVLCYMRPFTNANTINAFPQPKGSPKKQIRLGDGFIPAGHEDLFAELKHYRDSAYAHTDLAARNPRLIGSLGSLSEFPVGFSPVDRRPLHIHIDRMRVMFEETLALITQKVLQLESDLRPS